MLVGRFNEVLHARIEKVKAVLASKADDYATAKDRLHNFKAGAAAQGVTPAQCCLGYMTKHWVSVVDLVNDSAAGNSERVLSKLDEKIGDLANYCILLECVLLEECNGPRKDV